MALAAACTWEVRTTGSETSGGGFVTGASGTDWSQQDAAQVTFNGTTIAATCAQNGTTLTVSGYTTAVTDIGNILQITGGTNFIAGFYQITGQGTGTWTLDRTPATAGAGSAMTGAMGGALASPGKALGAAVLGNTIWVKSGTYSITSASTNVAAGCLSFGAGATATIVKIFGYGSTRGDGGTKPLLQASGISTFTLITLASDGAWVDNISLDGASLTSSRGISATGNSLVSRCKIANCTNNGYTSSAVTSSTELCEVTGCSTTTAVSGGCHQDLIVHDNTIGGCNASTSGATYIRCQSFNNTGASSDGFVTGTASSYTDCLAYGNGRHAFNVTAGNVLFRLTNCLAVGQTAGGANGFNASATCDSIIMLNCAGYNNTTNVSANILNNTGFVTLTADPFVNAAGSPPDFSLNNNAGGGAALRAAGLPTPSGAWAVPYLAASSNEDIGALQHAGNLVPLIFGA